MFYLIDDFEKILSLIEMGKSISEEIKPAAYEKNQLKVMAREERKSTVESVENPIQTKMKFLLQQFCIPLSAQSQKNPSNFSGENGSKCAETVEENRSQTAWLTSSAERSEQVLPKGQNKSRPKVGTSSAEKSEQVPPKGQNKFCQNDGTSSAQREDKSKYNQSKRKNLYMIERSTPAENSAEQFVENSEELAEKVRSSIGYYGIIPITGPNFADCAVKAICELMTTDKPVKLGSCEVAPNVIKKTISYVNRDIIMQVSDKVYKKRGKIHSLSAYLKTAIFQQTCEYLMLPQNEFGFEGYAEMRDFCKTYLSL
ncbi:MAG: hypothetical protein ACLSG5_08860 [Oscillospiraceae bacterium]